MWKMPHKIFILPLLTLALLLPVLWLLSYEYCFWWGTGELRRLEQTLSHKGYEVSYKLVEEKRALLSLPTLHLRDLRVKTPEGEVEWSGEAVSFCMRPWKLATVALTASGPQTLILNQGEGNALKTVRLEETQGTISFELYPTLIPESITLSAKKIAFYEKEISPTLLARDLSLHIANLTHPLTLHLSGHTRLEGIESFENLTLAVEASLSGFQDQRPFPQTLAAWREGGGVLEIKRAQLTCPPMRVEGEGTLTFDENMTPLGAFSTQSIGSHHLLNHMVKRGWVKKNTAPLIAFMVSMLGKPDEKGETTLTIPLTVQQGEVTLGSIPFPIYKFK